MLIPWVAGNATIVPGREMGAFSGRCGGNEPLENDSGPDGLGKVLRSQLAEAWRTVELVAVLSPWLKIYLVRIQSDRSGKSFAVSSPPARP